MNTKHYKPVFWKFWTALIVMGAMVLFILFLSLYTLRDMSAFGPTIGLWAAALFLAGLIVLSYGSQPPNAETLIFRKDGLDIWSRVTPKRGLYRLTWQDITEIIVYRNGGRNRMMVLGLTDAAAARHGLPKRDAQSYATQLDRVMRLGHLRGVKDPDAIVMIMDNDIGSHVLKLAAELVAAAEATGITGTLKTASIMGSVQYHWERD